MVTEAAEAAVEVEAEAHLPTEDIVEAVVEVRHSSLLKIKFTWPDLVVEQRNMILKRHLKYMAILKK